MDEKTEVIASHRGCGKGRLYVIGIGPGDLIDLTKRAREALKEADCLVGYTRYVDLVAPLAEGREVFSTGMTGEVSRCRKAIELTASGKVVAMVSSGDAGIYGMAGLVLEILASNTDGPGLEDIDVKVIPGIPAFVSAASLLGAPLMHDFASISLSDILTPWEKIEDRLRAAAVADFVIALYNPRSSKRKAGLVKAIDIVLEDRAPQTPVGIVKNATRKGEETTLTTLGQLHEYFERIDMLTIIIIGNAASFMKDGFIITPRGYKGI